MFNMFGNIFGRMFTPPASKEEESVFEGAECVNCKAETGYNPYCNGVRCYDKEDYLPEGYTEDELRSVYYDLNQETGIDYLVESAGFDEVDDYYNPGTEEVDPAFVLEAVTVKKFSCLEGVIRRGMLPVMKEHMKMKDPTTGEPINVLDPIVGKCKKSGGFAYVTAQIPFSDGQVVSIIFHAPEGDGKKIGPSDMVVAFRWLLNKRDITAVVAPEDGKEISLKTIALRLAQLVGKNAKRFAATQKEVQAEKRQLEELQEKQKELDEQAKTYEKQIAGAQEAKTSTAEEIGSLQAQLAKQLAANRELEIRLAGLKKLEEEGRKTEPEPAQDDKADKPEWLKAMYDIVDGQYDNFTVGNEVSKAVDSLEPVAEAFRRSNKSISDVYELFKTVQDLPWTVQEKFLKSDKNSDIVEVLKGQTEVELERLVFKERSFYGEKLLKEAGLPEKGIDFLYNREKEKYDELKQKFYELERKYNSHPELRGEYYAVKDKCDELSKKLRHDYFCMLLKANKILLNIKNNLLKSSKISQEEADEWVNSNVTLEISSINKILSSWKKTTNEEITLDIVKKELANIYRITNGKLNNMHILGDPEHPRSFADRKGNAIHWGTGDIGYLYHEAGHIFEYANQEHLAVAIRFVKDRATGKEKKLSTLTGNSGYKAYEKAYPDNFSNPYVGKVYRDENGKITSSEVLSMGLQILGNTNFFLQGIKDSEHLNFCFGCFISNPIKNGINNVYSVNNATRYYADNKKKIAWIEAIDNAMSDDFVTRLYSKGIERYKIVVDEYGGIILKHNSNIIAASLAPEEDDRIRFARLAYIAICNFKGLIPDADAKLEKEEFGIENLLDSAPKWFTPITELPRL